MKKVLKFFVPALVIIAFASCTEIEQVGWMSVEDGITSFQVNPEPNTITVPVTTFHDFSIHILNVNKVEVTGPFWLSATSEEVPNTDKHYNLKISSTANTAVSDKGAPVARFGYVRIINDEEAYEQGDQVTIDLKITQAAGYFEVVDAAAMAAPFESFVQTRKVLVNSTFVPNATFTLGSVTISGPMQKGGKQQFEIIYTSNVNRLAAEEDGNLTGNAGITTASALKASWNVAQKAATFGSGEVSVNYLQNLGVKIPMVTTHYATSEALTSSVEITNVPSWITMKPFEFASDFDHSGKWTIVVDVDTNELAARTAKMNITYTYGTNKHIVYEVVVNQAVDPEYTEQPVGEPA